MSSSLLITKTAELYLCSVRCAVLRREPSCSQDADWSAKRLRMKVTTQAVCGCVPSPLSGPPSGSSESKEWHKAANRRTPPSVCRPEVFLHAGMRWVCALPTLMKPGGELRGNPGRSAGGDSDGPSPNSKLTSVSLGLAVCLTSLQWKCADPEVDLQRLDCCFVTHLPRWRLSHPFRQTLKLRRYPAPVAQYVMTSLI